MTPVSLMEDSVATRSLLISSPWMRPFFCGKRINNFYFFHIFTLNHFRFKSDDTINSKGFSANYVIINEDNSDSDYEAEETEI